MLKLCRECGYVTPGLALFCGRCGSHCGRTPWDHLANVADVLRPPVTCRRCHREAATRTRFCPRCGIRTPGRVAVVRASY